MAYITAENLTDRFGEREINALTADGTDYSLLERAVARAQAEVDSVLSGRFTTPIAAPTELLKDVTADIARFHLYRNQPPEHIQKRYDAAVRKLADARDGKETLGLPGDLSADTLKDTLYESNDRIFTISTLSGF